jgi:hypothetical protein
MKTISFNAEMVRALIEGRKTQTRRPIKSPATSMQQLGQECIRRNPDNDPWYKDFIWSIRMSSGVWNDFTNEKFIDKFSRYKIGDRLWVRETHSFSQRLNYSGDDVDYVTCHYADGSAKIVDPPDESWGFDGGRKYPPIHMPQWASRITLEVTGVRVERVQDISEADAQAEGCGAKVDYSIGRTYRTEFSELWDSIYSAKKLGWSDNPYVFVYNFNVVDEKK